MTTKKSKDLEKTARKLAKTYKYRKACGDFVPSAHRDIVTLLEELEERASYDTKQLIVASQIKNKREKKVHTRIRDACKKGILEGLLRYFPDE